MGDIISSKIKDPYGEDGESERFFCLWSEIQRCGGTRMFIIWSIFGLVERIMKKTTSLGSESIPNVKNKNFALESFFLMISCKILKRLKNLDLV